MRSDAMKRQFAINGTHFYCLTGILVLNNASQITNAPRRPWPPVSSVTGKMTRHPKHPLLQWEPEFTSRALSRRNY